MLTVCNLSKSFGKKEVLKDVAFSVKKGDIFGYLGPNGAGKTTTIRIILGLYEPDSGIITIGGREYFDHRSRADIGVCMDQEGLHLDLTGYENLEFYDRIYSSVQGRSTRINTLLDLFHLKSAENQLVSQYSQGMRKRLGIARALLNKPKLLVLDEPDTGLDPDGQFLLQDIIRSLSRDIPIFLSSHNLGMIQGICNKVAIIKNTILYNGAVIKSDDHNIIELEINLRGKSIDHKTLEGFVKTPLIQLKVESNRTVFAVNEKCRDEVLRNLLDHEVSIVKIKRREVGLDKLYKSIVSGGSKNG